MKFLAIVGYLIAATSLVQCERDSGQTLPPGVYEEPTKVEKVTAAGQTLQFEVRMVRGRDQGKIFEGEYTYQLLTNGRINVRSSSSDSVFLEGIYLYDWSWDGKSIVRKKFNTDEVVTFARRDN
jgi:hypothetical protein